MSEFEWIARYFAPLARGEGAAGLRDDVAELDANGRLIATTDGLAETVHFLPEDPIDTVARKLVRVNVSDILCKGARPTEALLTLGWSNNRSEAELARFAAALGEDLSRWGARLVGGDTLRSPGGLFLSMTLIGRCHDRGPIRRSGGRAGDELWVTGVVGAGALGLRAVWRGETHGFAATYREPAVPPLETADLVAEHASAAMDVSDGLLADTAKLAGASGLGAELALDCAPFASEPVDLDDAFFQATGGDDYQILFAAGSSRSGDIQTHADALGVKVSRIGRLTAERGLQVTMGGKAVKLPASLGFEHS
ncbi:MAG: thiamine-phosphate kinase [Pseudomonadota bacterium]